MFDIISSNGTPPSKIIIEFTETALAENTKAVTDFANAMHEKGIRLGLDDFGTGYSNIESVICIPFDIIKLDKSIVWSAMEQKKSFIMTKNIIKAFQELGIQVLAEGVETEEQKLFITDCKIDLIQGFYFARPMPEHETTQFLQAHKI